MPKTNELSHGLNRKPRAGWLAAVSTVVLTLTLPAACANDGRPHVSDIRPNVVLVTVDTLRADHLEAYGYHRETAPGITELARSGVRFARAVSQAPWTLPSMASVHSALYPSQHGAIEADRALPDAAETLAEYLQAAGYSTLAVVSHSFVDRDHGFAQGFDVFNEEHILAHDAVTSERLTRTALGLVENAREPFFLWVHYFDPHFTYMRHPRYGFADGYAGSLPDELSMQVLQERQVSESDLDFIEAVYDEEVRYTDEWVSTLWHQLESRFGENRSVLVFTSDHGEYFLERGRFFHGRDVYRELIHVPLVISGGIDSTLRGTVVSQPVETRSIPRTVASMLGVSESGFGGVDLFSVARGSTPVIPAFSEGLHAWGTDQRKRAVLHDGWKLIQDMDQDRFELYHLADDPREQHDHWKDRSRADSVASALQSKLQDFAALPRLDPQAIRPRPIGVRQRIIERLRSLGYVR